MEPRSQRVAGADGVEIHVLEWSQEGVPLVLVHGFGNDAHVWDEFAPQVAPYYRTLALDLRGHGDSDRDAEQRYDYDYHLGDLEAVFASLGVERAVLVGHSLGGRVVTLFAGRHPERVAGLVLVDSGPDLDPRGVSRIRVDLGRAAEQSASFASPQEYERVLARAYPVASAETVTRMAHHGLRQRTDGRYERKTDPAFHAARRDATPEAMETRDQEMATKLWDALAKVACPALVVRGAASDILSPDTADRMAEDVLAQGRLAVVARAGHSVMVDNPSGFAEAVLDFVTG